MLLAKSIDYSKAVLNSGFSKIYSLISTSVGVN